MLGAGSKVIGVEGGGLAEVGVEVISGEGVFEVGEEILSGEGSIEGAMGEGTTGEDTGHVIGSPKVHVVP